MREEASRKTTKSDRTRHSHHNFNRQGRSGWIWLLGGTAIVKKCVDSV
jgi:hypothetical protein